MKQKLPKPTEAELEILQVLWDRGPSTVRDVYEALEKRKKTGYTTILKLMQIMAQKGLAVRDERQRSHVYAAGIAEVKTQRRMVKDLLDRVFMGSAENLVLRALESKPVAADELARIKRMLDEMEDTRHDD